MITTIDNIYKETKDVVYQRSSKVPRKMVNIQKPVNYH